MGQDIPCSKIDAQTVNPTIQQIQCILSPHNVGDKVVAAAGLSGLSGAAVKGFAAQCI